MSFFKCVVPAMLAGAFLYSPAAALPGSASSKNLTSAMEPAVIQVAQEQKNKKVVVKKQTTVVKKPVTVNRRVVVNKTVVYRPGYRYGCEAASRYQGRNWNDVEPELSSGWNSYEHRGTSTWEHVKHAVRDAWDRVMSHQPTVTK